MEGGPVDPPLVALKYVLHNSIIASYKEMNNEVFFELKFTTEINANLMNVDLTDRIRSEMQNKRMISC